MKLKSMAWEPDSNVSIGLNTSKHCFSREVKFHNGQYYFIAT